jgi:hypothetical protein
MGLYQGSFFDLVNATPAAVRLVDANGDQLATVPVSFTAAAPSSAALSSVASSATSVELLAANVNRHKFILHNDSTKTLKVAFAATASATAFSISIAAHGAYESGVGDYAGVISGIWAGINGSARVTEITA